MKHNEEKLIEVVEGATEAWEEVKCIECNAIVRFHPTNAMIRCEIIHRGETHINEKIDCPRCGCVIYRFPIQ